MPAAGTQVERGGLDGGLVAGGRVQDLQALRDDLRTDAVTRDDGDPQRTCHADHDNPAVRMSALTSHIMDRG